jgi:hypothetical protein
MSHTMGRLHYKCNTGLKVVAKDIPIAYFVASLEIKSKSTKILKPILLKIVSELKDCLSSSLKFQNKNLECLSSLRIFKTVKLM